MSGVFESKYQWNLYGSSGRASMGGSFLRTWRNKKGAEVILTQVEITGLWLDRASNEISFQQEDLRQEFVVRLPQVIIVRAGLEKMARDLIQAVDVQIPVVYELTDNTDEQSFKISISERKDSNHLKTLIAEIQYSGIQFDKGHWSFVIDQSCIGIFAEELNSSLKTFGRAA